MSHPIERVFDSGRAYRTLFPLTCKFAYRVGSRSRSVTALA